MFKHKYIAARVDRRTYLKGRFSGKFTGKLDPSSSDPIRERYYDLEIEEGEIETRQDHLVSWMENKEPDEFAGDAVFPIRLPGKINVTLHYLNGEVKHFKIALKQIKLKDCHLSGQVYTRNGVQGNIEGLISGYVLHHDMLVKEIAEEPAPVNSEKPLPPKKGTTVTTSTGSETFTSVEPSPNRTHFLKILGGLIGLGLLVASFFLVKNWALTGVSVLSSGFIIRWLHNWISKRYGLRMSRSITTFLVILILIGFIFYLAGNYQKFAYTQTSKTRHSGITNIKDLKKKASDFLAKNHHQDALELYDRLLEIEANDPILHYQRALCYVGLERVSDAVEDLRLLVTKGDPTAIALNDQINPIKRRQIGTVIRCKDGTISNSKSHQGTCSSHGGVENWEEPVYKEYREY